MCSLPKVYKPSPVAASIQWSTELLRLPGVYWFQPETMPRALMVDVHVRDGQLTVWWPNEAQPVAIDNKGIAHAINDLSNPLVSVL